VRAHDLQETFTLTDYRRRYALYRSDPDLQAAHASTPFIATYDDHEVVNNWAGEMMPDGPPAHVFRFRRAAALQAFYEHMPVRRRGGAASTRAYRRFTFGRTLQLLALDTRLYRSGVSCPNGIGERCAETFDPEASMLGEVQEKWLFKQLKNTATRWNAIAQQVPLMQLDRNANGRQPWYKLDTWDGYVAARQRLLDFFERQRPRNPVVLSGDVHTAWAAYLKQDPLQQRGRVFAPEFIAPSITSASALEALEDLPQVLARNPHVRYFDSRRGYLACEVDDRRWRSDYQLVLDVASQHSAVVNAASYVLERGSPRIQRAR
jgi:alkaline phosphatase D